jgi:spermidine synthase
VIRNETVVLAREETARGEVALRRREDANGQPIYEIISNGVFLMASTNAPSARQLAHLALEPLAGREDLHVLIGGLGMGFTLQAALEYPAVARVQVVEVEPLIVAWARAHFGPLNGDALSDERVHVAVEDLAHYVATVTNPYDAILLDVDNGPTWLVFEDNAAVYERPALEQMRTLLAPGGVLAVWAAEPAPGFLAELGRVFYRADEVAVEEQAEGRTTEYFVYRARRRWP